METLVLTVIGDDRSSPGCGAVRRRVSDHGGSWERSHMARLAGKFAGIVVVAIPDDRVQGFLDDLATGLQGWRRGPGIEIRAERGDDDASGAEAVRLSLELVGADRPGIVHTRSRGRWRPGTSASRSCRPPPARLRWPAACSSTRRRPCWPLQARRPRDLRTAAGGDRRRAHGRPGAVRRGARGRLPDVGLTSTREGGCSARGAAGVGAAAQITAPSASTLIPATVDATGRLAARATHPTQADRRAR